MRIALGVPHAPWIEGRAESLDRLRLALDVRPHFDTRPHGMHVAYEQFSDREPFYAWSDRMHRWAAETDADYFLTLQDDAVVATNFWQSLRAMLIGNPGRIIGLQAPHPMLRQLAIEGHRWATSADGLVGVGYVMPLETLRAFLAWKISALRTRAVEAITEDTLIDVFAIATQRRIFHPIPTIVDHEAGPSSYAELGNDGHRHRRSVVTWRDLDAIGLDAKDLESPEAWRVTPSVPHMGRFYGGTHHLARRWVKGWTGFDAAEADGCPERWRAWL